MSLNDNQNQVQFEGERQMLYSRFEPSDKTPAVVLILMKLGIKSKKQANVVVIGMVLVMIIVAVILFWTSTRSILPENQTSLRTPSGF